jgi:prepilin-type N-terminal cleavage/methylation domain-containing protein
LKGGELKVRKQKGFTLIEMLVVIAIIAILAGAVILAINPAATMQKSRDATRLNDMDALRSAINLALAEGEIQLIATGPHNSGDKIQNVEGSTGYVRYSKPNGKVGLGRYLPALPLDPVNSATDGLVYTFQSTVDDYELNCVLEHPDNAVKMATDGGNNNPDAATNKVGAYEVGTNLTLIP